MKYWRGYLVALLLFLGAWGLNLFASSHQALMDTFYPYVTRLLLDSLGQWSGGVDFCLWQLLLLAFVVAVLAAVVLMFILRWNPIQVAGWVLAVVALVNLLNTGLYGLNQYTGSIADDLRLPNEPYAVTDLQTAVTYFRDKANELSSAGSQASDFETLAEKAADGFYVMVYERSASVLAGSRQPVKELGWADYYTGKGVTGVTVGLTGEAAVNPNVPQAMLPFSICREMAHRMCIVTPENSAFAAFLTCEANPDARFRYAGFLAAYDYCLRALESFGTSSAQQIIQQVTSGANTQVTQDLESYRSFLKEAPAEADTVCNLLVNWHIQYVVLPSQAEEPPLFDPTDETQVDLSGIRSAPAQ